MNVVTGAAGFIGSHLVDRLLQVGEAVRVVEHPAASVEHLPLKDVELVRADIRDTAAMQEVMRGCTRVYHLAADPNLWRRDRREFDAVNHVGALNVMRAALDGGFWCGMTLYPTTKCTPQRAVDIIERYGTERIMANSAGDWGKSDPLAVPELILEMRRRGHPEAAIRKIVYDNPLAFFRQSARWAEPNLRVGLSSGV